MQIVAEYAFKGIELYIDNLYNRHGMHKHLIKFDANTIEYYDSNDDRPVLLLLHGFGAEAKYQWYLQISLLRKNFRVIMPNLLYFGNSTNREGKYGVQDQVVMLKGLLDELNVSCCKVIGASYGGLVGAELARQTELVEELFLMGAPIKFMYVTDSARVEEHFDIDHVSELFVPDNAKQMKKLIKAATGKASWIPSFFLKPFLRKFYSGTREEKKRLMEQLIEIREEYAGRSYEVDIPVHLIWGSNDPLVPSKRAEFLAEHIGKSATLDIIPEGGHMANMVRPSRFNAILKKYL